MRSLVLLFITLFSFSACNQQAPLSDFQRKAIIDSVRQVADSVFAAASRRDVAMYSFYTPSTTALIAGKEVSFAEHQATAPAFFASLRSATFQPLVHEIEVLAPTVALWRGQYEYTFIDTSGKRTNGTGAQTWLFTHRPEGWRIVHVHISYPPPSAK